MSLDERAGLLICLDFQENGCKPFKPDTHGVGLALDLLKAARMRDWRIVHSVFLPRIRRSTTDISPLSGFLPQSGEPVFGRTEYSAYGHSDLLRAIVGTRARAKIILSAAPGFAAIATAIDALARDDAIIISSNTAISSDLNDMRSVFSAALLATGKAISIEDTLPLVQQ